MTNTATQTAKQELWMDENEFHYLEKEAGRPFRNVVEAHSYRIHRLKNRLVSSMLTYGDPMEDLLRESAARLERDRREFTQQLLGRNVVQISFEIFELLKGMAFPKNETERFLRMLTHFGQENPALLCLAEGVRIRQRTGR